MLETKATNEKNKDAKCTYPNCNGKGNTRKGFNTHTAVRFCPLANQNNRNDQKVNFFS